MTLLSQASANLIQRQPQLIDTLHCSAALVLLTRYIPDKFKAYVKQCREELGVRLVDRVFADGTKSKWWQFFSKRKFMGKEMQ
jgi:ARP2/3 complex ARPC3 (21 kDa) subunit